MIAPPSRSGVHALCDAYVRDLAVVDPVEAAGMGLSGYNDRLTDLSPDGYSERAELRRAALRQIRATPPADDSEASAAAVFEERVGLELELHDAGLDGAELGTLFSPVVQLRASFDLVPTTTPDDWAVLSTRMSAVPEALAGLRASLSAAAAAGRVSARRQVRAVANQCATWSGAGSAPAYFSTLIAGAGEAELSDTLRGDLAAAADRAGAAVAEFGDFLRTELDPRAPERDAVGADRYALGSRHCLGARLDLAEAYEWGWTEFLAIEAELREVGDRIVPGGSPAQVAAALDADPRYQVHGSDGLRAWMQEISDRAVADLRGATFDIPEELTVLECRIAPPGGPVGAYYTPPSADFSRPGRMWWTVDPQRTVFPTWRETTTVYHEGVPGHHLQMASVVANTELNDFQRLACWVPGHGEGWALYAERLMRELGYLDDAGDLFGMLDQQLFRAARVVVDIGMHLELEIPRGTGFHEGERWTPELGLEFMTTRTVTDAVKVRDEIDRYLGWPGQAPSYKLGERLWRQARDETRVRQGSGFDEVAFHREALAMGSMGLDVLRERLATI